MSCLIFWLIHLLNWAWSLLKGCSIWRSNSALHWEYNVLNTSIRTSSRITGPKINIHMKNNNYNRQILIIWKLAQSRDALKQSIFINSFFQMINFTFWEAKSKIVNNRTNVYLTIGWQNRNYRIREIGVAN